MTSKRKWLSLEEKVAVIEAFKETKKSYRELSKMFNVGKTQISKILKDKETICKLRNKNNCNQYSKKRLKRKAATIDSIILKWYCDLRNKNIAVSGAMLQVKALKVAKTLGYNEGNFKASNGWLQRFKLRHNIKSNMPIDDLLSKFNNEVEPPEEVASETDLEEAKTTSTISVSTKRKRLSLEEKIEVIDTFKETKKSHRQLSKIFNVGKTQISKILKDEKAICKLWNENNCNLKNESTPGSEQMLQVKALEVAQTLECDEGDFNASNGCLQEFELRHNTKSSMSPDDISSKSNDELERPEEVFRESDLEPPKTTSNICASKKKRLSLEEQTAVINTFEETNLSQYSNIFNAAKTPISNNLKDEDTICKLCNENDCNLKNENITISEQMLQEKAQEVAKTLECNEDDFKASSGWLQSFKLRHDIKGNMPVDDTSGKSDNQIESPDEVVSESDVEAPNTTSTICRSKIKLVPLEEQIAVIDAVEETKKSQSRISNVFNAGKTQTTNILKDEEAICNLGNENHCNLKHENILVSGQMLQVKALEVAQILECTEGDFNASNGCLQGFELRHTTKGNMPPDDISSKFNDEVKPPEEIVSESDVKEPKTTSTLCASKRKRLSLAEKIAVIDAFRETKKSHRELSKMFNVGKTQISNILKDKEAICKLRNEKNCNQYSKSRLKGEAATIDSMVYKWYCALRNKDIPVSGPMLQVKALKVAKTLGYNEGSFKASNGWLQSFKLRHNIKGNMPIDNISNISNDEVEPSEEVVSELDLEEVKTTSTICASKRKWLSLEEKIAVIDAFEETKKSQRELSKMFDVGKTQISNILKDKEAICMLWNENNCNQYSKRRLSREAATIDAIVYEWYCSLKNENIPVSGQMLQVKALEVSKTWACNEGDFKASNGWLQRFKLRHKITSNTPITDFSSIPNDEVHPPEELVCEPDLEEPKTTSAIS